MVMQLAVLKLPLRKQLVTRKLAQMRLVVLLALTMLVHRPGRGYRRLLRPRILLPPNPENRRRRRQAVEECWHLVLQEL